MKLTDGINLSLFSKPIIIAELIESCCADIPNSTGVYCVLRNTIDAPKFIYPSKAGHFNDKDPTVEVDILRDNWVSLASIMYIGMTKSKKGLKGRIRQFVNFASGAPAPHWSGRLLWQLSDWRNLEICYFTECENPNKYESELIARFKCVHDGKRPFANLNK